MAPYRLQANHFLRPRDPRRVAAITTTFAGSGKKSSMHFKVGRAVLGLVFMATIGCGNGGGGSSLPTNFSEFDSAIETFLVDEQLEGATAAIVHRDAGILHLRGYGAYPEDRISLIASSSKVMSVGVLMYLVDAGLLDIDAPITDYLSEWGFEKSDITVAQLVSNSSGLFGLTDGALYQPYLCQYTPNASLTRCARSIYRADDEADRIPPDTRFRYGGGQWQLAGGVAEVVSGKSWAELIDEVYVQPCGFEHTAYNNHFFASALNPGAGLVDYPSFFDGDPANLAPTANPNIEGGAYTTIRDYAKLLLMHLRGGLCDDNRVLSEASVNRMVEDRVGAYGGTSLDPEFPGYGLGWFLDVENGVSTDGGAYGSSPWIDIRKGYGVVFILEANFQLGGRLRGQLRPIVDRAFD